MRVSKYTINIIDSINYEQINNKLIGSIFGNQKKNLYSILLIIFDMIKIDRIDIKIKIDKIKISR